MAGLLFFFACAVYLIVFEEWATICGSSSPGISGVGGIPLSNSSRAEDLCLIVKYDHSYIMTISYHNTYFVAFRVPNN